MDAPSRARAGHDSETALDLDRGRVDGRGPRERRRRSLAGAALAALLLAALPVQGAERDWAGEFRSALALAARPETRADGLRAFDALRAALAPELSGEPSPVATWCYAQVAARLAAEADTAAGRKLELDAAELVATARAAARRLADDETGALVELVWSGVVAERGGLLEAERIAAEALTQFPAAVGYGSELRLVRARILRRAARWQPSLEELDVLEGHLERNAEPLGRHRAGYESGLWGERAQIWTELGVLDKAQVCLDAEELWAGRSGRAEDAQNRDLHRADTGTCTAPTTRSRPATMPKSSASAPRGSARMPHSPKRHGRCSPCCAPRGWWSTRAWIPPVPSAPARP
jgi:hypothetical protein